MLERSRKWGHPVHNGAITVRESYRGSEVSELRPENTEADIYDRVKQTERERERERGADKEKGKENTMTSETRKERSS